MLKRIDRYNFLSGAYFLAYYYPTHVNISDQYSQSLLRFKDGIEPEVTNWSKVAGACLKNVIDVDLIIRVLGSKEIKANGNSPLDVLCKEIEKSLITAKYSPDLLWKTRPTASLHSLPSKSARVSELNGVYKFKLPPYISNSKPIKLLLVDDIITSGTTMVSIYQAIKRISSNINVYFFSLGKTYDSWKGDSLNNNHMSVLFTKYLKDVPGPIDPINDLGEDIELDEDIELSEVRPLDLSVGEVNEESETDNFNVFITNKDNGIPPGPNLVLAKNGEWEPAKGYKWANSIPGDFTVVINPPGPNLIRTHDDKWRPASGYNWANSIPGDFTVVKDGCFIATTVYGDYNSLDVFIFRNFRDNYLQHHLIGKLFIRFYYWIGPSLSIVISFLYLKTAVRFGLDLIKLSILNRKTPNKV